MDDQREELAKLGLITLGQNKSVPSVSQWDHETYKVLSELLDHISTEYHMRFGIDALQHMKWNYLGVDLYKRLVSGLAG
jgi:hypothetical protein